MIIQTSHPAVLPRKLVASKSALPAQPPARALHPFPVPGTPIHGFLLAGSLATVPPAEPDDRSEKILRLVCNLIANQVGGKVKIANSLLWLTLDAHALKEDLQDPKRGTGEKAAATLAVAADAVSLLAGAPGWQGLQHVTVPLYFAAEVGDRMATGRYDVTLADLAGHFDDPQAELLKLPELLK